LLYHSTVERAYTSAMRVFLLMLIALTTLIPSTSRANDQRPFWTEQSSFTIGDALYAIGVATNAASVEEGRQAAFANGLGEIRNYYGPVSNLDGVVIETQMTYQEEQQNGRVSVWRLLQVSLDSLRMAKATKTHRALASQITTQRLREPQEAPRVFSTEPSHTAAVSTPKAPVEVRAVTTTRQPAVNLPTIPLRYPQIITGWTQDTHGRIGVEWEDRQEWYVPVRKASDLSYATR
jgi:hypothetical protein